VMSTPFGLSTDVRAVRTQPAVQVSLGSRLRGGVSSAASKKAQHDQHEDHNHNDD
jgi:hypothetical protein